MEKLWFSGPRKIEVELFRMKIIMSAIIAMIVALVSGCQSMPKLNQTQAANLLPAPYPPTKAQLLAQMDERGQTIVLTPLDTDSKLQTRYAKQAYEMISQQLMGTGNQIVDRSLAKKLKNELVAAEKSGHFSNRGPAVASIAMMPTFSKLSISKKFQEARVFVNSSGQRIRISPKCRYYTKAEFFVRAYRIPTMELVNKYTYQGSAVQKTDARSSRCPIGPYADALFSAAIDDAIKHGVPQTLNDITPPAYIIGRRDVIDDDSMALFRISMSRLQGAVSGLDVDIFRLEKRTNALTERTRFEKIKLGAGVVTPYIDRQGAYILVDDKELIDQIRLGDIVKVKHDKCIKGEFELLGRCVSLSKLTSNL